MDEIRKTISKYVNWQLYDNLQDEWIKYRDLAKKKRCPKQIDKYLESLIAGDIPTYLLKENKKLYRAQLVKKKDRALLGLDFDCICEQAYLEVVGEELTLIRDSSFKMAPRNIYLMRKELMPETEHQYEEAVKRIIYQKEATTFWGFKKERCGIPPEQYRRAGRLNTKKDGFLYLAMEENTAIKEMKPILGQEYSIAVGNCTRTLKLADLVNKKKFGKNPAFLYFLSSKISEPNIEIDEEFYRITQLLAHKLRDNGFDGILYDSSVSSNGRNVLIFEEGNIDFKSSKCVTIENIAITYSV